MPGNERSHFGIPPKRSHIIHTIDPAIYGFRATADFQVSKKARSHFPCEGLRSEASPWIIPHRGKSLFLPGPLDSPPISSQSAPREIIFRACSRAFRKTRIFLHLKRSQESHSKPPSISGGPDRVTFFGYETQKRQNS
ncbi:MAG: hypothetical protein Ct9H90mP8_3450 [Pseudomonadota bacterium]|nr:MAG: hypothetical protein Ct9H90mP8_3450 [Pseudomonadota bacterium]